MTQGHKGDLFIFDLSFFGWMLLSGLTCGILGIVYVNPYMYTAHAGLYDALKDNAIRQGILRWEDFGSCPLPPWRLPFRLTAIPNIEVNHAYLFQLRPESRRGSVPLPPVRQPGL